MSCDAVAANKAFHEKFDFAFPLLSDVDKSKRRRSASASRRRTAPGAMLWKSTSVSWVHPTIQRTRRKILISTQLRQVRARDGRRRRRRRRQGIDQARARTCRTPARPQYGAYCAQEPPRRRDGRPRNLCERPDHRRRCARTPRSYPTKVTGHSFAHGFERGFTLGAAAGCAWCAGGPGRRADAIRTTAPARAAGPAGPAAVVVGAGSCWSCGG